MRTHSEQINELAAALVAAQGEFSVVSKTSENPFFHSKYASLPDVVKTAAPVLAKNGLAVSQFLGTGEHDDTLTTWLIHTSGQFICESMRLHMAKKDAQSQGSATTYARRFAYMAVLGLVADEDDDGNKATQPPARQPESQPHPELVNAAAGLRGLQLRQAYSDARIPYPTGPLFVGLDNLEVTALTTALLNQHTDVPIDPSDFEPPVDPEPANEFERALQETFGATAETS